MPHLEVLTRCYKRPNSLKVNRASLARQTDGDWFQTLLVDDVGRGIGWSYRNMAAYAPHLVGEYIWILDDDDECIRDAFVAELKEQTAAKPEIVFVRMNHAKLGILPAAYWGDRPALGDMGCSAFVVRRDVWQRHADSFGAHYAGDFEFIAAAFAATTKHIWWDVIASRVQRISHGMPE